MQRIIVFILTVSLILCISGRKAPEQTPEEEKAFKASEMIRNADLWNGVYMFDDEFKFVVEYLNMKTVEAGMGTNYTELGGDFLHNEYSTGEWGHFYDLRSWLHGRHYVRSRLAAPY